MIFANIFASSIVEKNRRIKHQRIAPMGGFIGFIREKYYDDYKPKKVKRALKKLIYLKNFHLHR